MKVSGDPVLNQRTIVFVGHSFAPDDRDVVGVFTRHLEQFKWAGLEWVDAEPGQGGSVANKVKSLLDTAPIFLGIFTRKYRLDGLAGASGRRHWATRLMAPFAPAPRFAASAWTFQESGYAIARGADYIFLVENDVADMGGLQGDIFLIRFSREDPKVALTELTGQLNDILAKRTAGAHPPSTAVSEPPEPPAADGPRRTPEGEAPAVLEDFLAMMKALQPPGIDRGAAEQAYRRAFAKAETDDDREFTEVEYAVWRIRAGVATGFDDLLGLVANRPSRRSLNALADYWRSLGDHEKALGLYQRAAAPADSRLMAGAVRGGWATSLVALKRFAEARGVLLAGFAPAVSDEERVVICEGLANVAKAEESREQELAWLEYGLSFRPVDHEDRFRAAYLSAELDRHEQALLHYKRLAREAPSGPNRNNLGVTCARLGLKGRAVEAYKRAENDGETLAMANRANIMLDAGLYEEAEAIIEKAAAIPKHHSNVGGAKVRLEELRESESKQEEAALEKAEKERRFFVAYAEALKEEAHGSTDAGGRWGTPFGSIQVNVEGERISGSDQATGTGAELDEAIVSLVAARMGGGQIRATKSIAVEGTVRGRAGKARLTKKVWWDWRKDEPVSSAEVDILFVAKGTRLSVLEQRVGGRERSVTEYLIAKPV